MKKLSEIGTRQVGTEWDVLKQQSQGYFYWVFREDERRELVRAAIEAERRGVVGDIEKFFEEQGI